MTCYVSSTIFADVNVKNIFTSHIDKKTSLTSLYIFSYFVNKKIVISMLNCYCREHLIF